MFLHLSDGAHSKKRKVCIHLEGKTATLPQEKTYILVDCLMILKEKGNINKYYNKMGYFYVRINLKFGMNDDVKTIE